VRSDPTEPDLAAVAFLERVIGPDRWARLPERIKEQRRREGAALLSDLAIARTDLPFHFDDVLCAVSVCSGANTDHRFAQSARDLANELTYADRHTIPDAQHGAHLSQPEAFAQWVQAVVDRARQ
jgi:pimeloyl-ACP methyl ester carboxylesterase